MAETFNQLFGGKNRRDKASRNPFLVGRVIKVIIGPLLEDGTPDPDYKSIADIGKIKYVLMTSNQVSDGVGEANRPARPFFSFINQYPVENEMVYLLPGPGIKVNEDLTDVDLYYLPPIKLWGSQHHNAVPQASLYRSYINSTAVDYETNQEGFSNKTIQVPISYPLGGNFIESENVKSIIPFTGDVVLEGRYGNSIRFGHSNSAYSIFNNWSRGSTDGDPITIIRNGQGNQQDKLGYNPTVEDINVDQSSIYLTAGQSITIEDLNGFPLESWDVVLQNKPEIVVTATPLPLANETLSAKDQDNLAASPTSTSTNTTSSDNLGLSEGELEALDQEYVNFYNNFNTAGQLDDGIDAYYHYKIDNLPKIPVQASQWRVGPPETVNTSGDQYDKATYPTQESLIAYLTQSNPRFPQKLAEGKKVIVSYEGTILKSDQSAFSKWNSLTKKLLGRNESKIKTINNTRGQGS